MSRHGRWSPLRNSLRASTFDVACYSGMVGLGESYFAAFALLLAATPMEVGLLTTFPVLVGSIVQLGAPAVARSTGDHPLGDRQRSRAGRCRRRDRVAGGGLMVNCA